MPRPSLLAPQALDDGLRRELVLKKASSVSGKWVVVGRYRDDGEWREVVKRALWEEDWVVQEYVEPSPYCFQSGQAGAASHEMVWGLFVFGSHFGGAYLRLTPAGRTLGVVNGGQGAEVDAVLEIVE